MKLCLCAGLVFSLLTIGLGSLREDYLDNDIILSLQEHIAGEQDMDSDGDDTESLSQYLQEQFQTSEEDGVNQQDPDGDLNIQNDPYFMYNQDDDSQMMEQFPQDEKLPKDAVKELKDMLTKHTEQVAIVEASACTRKKLQQGSTVALQFSADKRVSLGCAGAKCGGAGCPRLFMEGHDWNGCWGEVFQIYRPLGPGTIVAGDFVGLYYPRSKQWFSLHGNYGRRLSCPGNPTHSRGFASLYHWFYCGGEVFQIYAKGKGKGSPIEDHDNIMLYYRVSNAYVRFMRHKIDVTRCPLHKSHNRFPPNNVAYDQCILEVAELTIK